MNENNELIETQVVLFEKNLVIPEYQRPYTWDSKHIDKMIDDFKEHLKFSKDQQYYLGAILLHKEKNKDEYNIIDGQQRITTLLLLKIILEQNRKEINYENLQSQKRIKLNYDYLNEKKEKLKEIEPILDNICFTVLVVHDVDDAFTFFDTQNNRGVQPSVLVLLKAFNLRTIDDSTTQIECAKSWDSHERDKNYVYNKDDKSTPLNKLSEKSEKLEWLIKIFFYRVRKWKGDKKAEFGFYDKFRDGFTKDLRKTENQEYVLFPSSKNKKILSKEYETTVKLKNEDWFDFAVRQPIYQGEGFFRFLDYYANLLDILMEIEIYNGKKFRVLLEVYRVGSAYIASFMTMITLTYYDRFGTDSLNNFIVLVDRLIADVRISSSRILRQTLEKQFIRCAHSNIEQNILDYLCSAFDSQEVLEWLGEIPTEEYSELSGVRKRFNDMHKEFWGINNGK